MIVVIDAGENNKKLVLE